VVAPSLAIVTTAEVDAYFKPVDAELTFARHLRDLKTARAPRA
jgi:hypothetical protein